MADGSMLNYPALVLNADFRPLSYFPLSLWSWQDTMKAVWLDRVSILSEYEAEVHSPQRAFRLPSVIALKDYIPSACRYVVFPNVDGLELHIPEEKEVSAKKPLPNLDPKVTMQQRLFGVSWCSVWRYLFTRALRPFLKFLTQCQVIG